MRTKLVPADPFKRGFQSAQDSIYSEAIALNLPCATGRARPRNCGARAGARLRGPACDPVRSTPTDRHSCSGGHRERQAECRDCEVLSRFRPRRQTGIVASAARLGSTFLWYRVADDALTVWVVTPDGVVRATTRERAAVEARHARAGDDPADRIPEPPGGRQPPAWRELYGSACSAGSRRSYRARPDRSSPSCRTDRC